MNLKRLTAAALAAVLVITGVAGCKSKDADEGKKSAKGKYVEKEITLPLKESEEPAGMVQKGDKTLRFYTKDKNTGQYKAYDYNGEKFADADASWLNPVTEQNGIVMKIIQGEDGEEYVLYTADDSLMHVLKEGQSTEVPLPELAQPGEYEMTPYISAMQIDKNGNIFLADVMAKKIRMYGPAGGNQIKSFDAGSAEGSLFMPIDVKDQNLLVMNIDGDGFICYDTENDGVTSETKYDGTIETGSLKLGSEKDIYFTDGKGIHHLTLGGTVSEDVIDGNSTSLGIPQTTVENLFFGKESQYYAVIRLSDVSGSTYKLYEYVYDKEAKAVPDKTLTIYGLTESSTVRQAIARFQREHPDVGVEYKTGNSGEGTATKADSIRALNTELLGGNGADVIMLDGLPVQSYIEKGVLDDLSDAVKESELQENIIKPYKQDGKIYQIPTRYGIPILLGNKEKMEAVKSIEGLKDYMERNPNEKIFEGVSAKAMMRFLIDMNYKSLVDENMKVQTKELTELMKLAKQASDPTADDISGQFAGQESVVVEMSGWDIGNLFDYADNGTVASKEIKGVMGMMIPYCAARENQEQPSDADGIYVPRDIAGVNKASKQKELAQKFIETLLSEEVQSLDIEGGMPVNKKAMEAFVQSVEEVPEEDGMSLGISVAASADGEETEPASEPMIITLPYRSEVKSLAELSNTLTKPVQTDDVTGEMMQNEADAYFEGTSSAEDAAKAAATKADTYLAQ